VLENVSRVRGIGSSTVASTVSIARAVTFAARTLSMVSEKIKSLVWKPTEQRERVRRQQHTEHKEHKQHKQKTQPKAKAKAMAKAKMGSRQCITEKRMVPIDDVHQ